MSPHTRNQSFIGVTIIFMGIAMILSSMDIRINGLSPWTFFAYLTPAFWALIFGWEHYWQHGRVLDLGAIWVFGPILVAIILIFNLSWVWLTAVIFILMGLAFIFGQRSKEKELE